MKPQKTYIFEGPHYGWFPELAIEIDGQPHARPTMSESTYDRFVALANSGNYAVEILDSDHGVAWSLRRKAAA